MAQTGGGMATHVHSPLSCVMTDPSPPKGQPGSSWFLWLLFWIAIAVGAVYAVANGSLIQPLLESAGGGDVSLNAP